MKFATSFALLLLSYETPVLSARRLRVSTARLQKAKADHGGLVKEDRDFWDRFLQDQGSIPQPTDAPVPSPTTPAMTNAPIVPPTDAPVTPPTDAPVTPPTDAPVMPPTEAPIALTQAPTDPPVMAPVALPTEAPVVPPTEAPVAPPTEAPPTEAPVNPTSAPVASTPAPTDPPAPECPTLLTVDCTLADGTPCVDAVPPASGSGDGCEVQPTYTYTLVNDSDDQERIYSLQVNYGGFFTSIGNFETEEVLLDPAESIVVTNTEEVNICGAAGIDVFVLEATLFTGPPISVNIVISCVAEDGQECASIGVTTDPAQCLLDITYTYTITNTGLASTEFQSFSRTRNGETVDLLPLVDDPLLPIGATTSFQETEEIDTCIEQDFTTTTSVVQAPSADFLCSDQVGYP